MYACICHAVTDRELDSVITTGATSEEAIGRACGAGTGCGSCLDRICDRLTAMRITRGEAALSGMAAS